MTDYGVEGRFEELCAEFTARSERKNPSGGRALIEHVPPYPGMCWTMPWGEDRWVLQPQGERWSIRYVNADGSTIHWGADVGHTKAGVIAWLLRARKAFP